VLGRVATGAEHDRVPDGVGHRVDGMRRGGGPPVGVHTDMAKIETEEPFHGCARATVQRRARPAQHLADDRRRLLVTVGVGRRGVARRR
jgi:hypothetical protein